MPFVQPNTLKGAHQSAEVAHKKCLNNMSTVKLGLSKMNPADMTGYCQGIHDAIVGNAHYTTPLPTAATVQTAIDALVAANAAVSLNNGRQEHSLRRVAQLALHGLMKQWQGYVQQASGGDADIIATSGFAVVERGVPHGEPVRPTDLGILDARKTGRIAMDWERPAGAQYFHVFRSTTSEPFKWELVGVTSKTRYNSDGNSPGTFYWYAVSAIGAAGESSLSDPLHAMAAA